MLEHNTRALDTRVPRPDARHLESPAFTALFAYRISKLVSETHSHSDLAGHDSMLDVSLTRMDTGALGAIPAKGTRAGESPPGRVHPGRVPRMGAMEIPSRSVRRNLGHLERRYFVDSSLEGDSGQRRTPST